MMAVTGRPDGHGAYSHHQVFLLSRRFLVTANSCLILLFRTTRRAGPVGGRPGGGTGRGDGAQRDAATRGHGDRVEVLRRRAFAVWRHFNCQVRDLCFNAIRSDAMFLAVICASRTRGKV